MFLLFKNIVFLIANIEGQTNIPSVAFPKIQDLSLLCLVILCPAYATVRLVGGQTVRQDLAIKLDKYLT
jgi:hypothetical protein